VKGSSSLAVLLLLATGSSEATFSATKGFTLAEAEQVYRSVRSGLGRGFDSPLQRFIFWIEEGNLVVAREPEFAPKILVPRQESSSIGRVVPSSDGRSLFYVRVSKGTPATRELVQLDTERETAPIVVASGSEVPTGRIWFAPGGQAFAFVEEKSIHEFRRTKAGRWERRPLLDAREDRHAAATSVFGLVYSPDGMQLAFESARKARQKYIAIHDIAKGETRYLDPGIFKDDAPIWSPDGTELAFVREPGNWTMNYRFTSQREGAPWSIIVANVKTGAVRTVWKADPGRGSMPSTSDPLLYWTKEGQLIFTWEKTGWNLLYAVPAHGGPVKLLTPGEGEVDGATLSADGQTLAYTTNISDLARGHVWSLSLAGGKPLQLTTGKGVESAARFSAGGFLSYTAENRDEGPSQVFIRTPDGKVRPLAHKPPDIVRRNQAMWDQFLPSDTVSVRAEDGLTSYHIIIRAKGSPPPGGYPVIVNAHGGPLAQTRPGSGYAFTFGQFAASRGYLFVDMNYRGGSGFGLDYRLPDGGGATGGSEVKDLAALVGYLKGRGDVNRKRVGVMGGSYGGHIVGLAMSRLSDDYAAGVSLSGVADWVLEMKKDQDGGAEMSEPPEYIRLSERSRIEDLAYASSPAAHLENWRGPTLLTIGDLDTSGHVEAVIDLGNQLLARGVPVEFHVDPAGGHIVFPQERVFEFFERNLKLPGPE
jgi:dipeptidyl aminopeptidase/acylaminoacyl peptidase